MSPVADDSHPAEAVKAPEQHDDTTLNGNHEEVVNGNAHVADSKLKLKKLADSTTGEPSETEDAEPETASDEANTQASEEQTKEEVAEVCLMRILGRFAYLTRRHRSLPQ